MKKKNYIAILSLSLLILWIFYEAINCYKEGTYTTDPLVLYYHFIVDLSLYYLQLLMPIFIIIPSIWFFHKELHSGYIKYCLVRTDYKTYLKKQYFKAIKSSLILPIFVIILLIVCCILTKSFAFGTDTELYGWLSSPSPKYLSNIYSFMLTYIVVMFLHGILYCNLGLMAVKKNSNILVSFVIGYLLFLIFDIIMEIFVGSFLITRLLNIHNVSSSLSFASIWTFDNVVSLPFMIIYSLILVIISSLIVYFMYKDKEKLLYECEK